MKALQLFVLNSPSALGFGLFTEPEAGKGPDIGLERGIVGKRTQLTGVKGIHNENVPKGLGV